MLEKCSLAERQTDGWLIEARLCLRIVRLGALVN
jgi:hypothetical protein